MIKSIGFYDGMGDRRILLEIYCEKIVYFGCNGCKKKKVVKFLSLIFFLFLIILEIKKLLGIEGIFVYF